MAALTGRIQRLKGIIPAKLISADLGAPSLSSPLDRVSGEGERSLVNDFPIVKKAGTDSVAFPLVDDKDERTTVTDNNNFGEIGPSMELYAEPSITGKQAEVDMDVPTYAHVVLDKMIEPCLTTDRVSDGEDVVIGEMQSSEGEEGERDEVDGPVIDQSEEGPVASESKGEVRGRRVEACKVFENVPQSKTDGPEAGYGHSGFVQNGAGQSWADIVGNREICYPRPLVSESNGARSEMELEFIKCSEDSSEEINVNKGTKRGGAENKEDKETDMDSDSGWHRVNKKKYGNRRKSQEKGQTVGKTKAQPSQGQLEADPGVGKEEDAVDVEETTEEENNLGEEDEDGFDEASCAKGRDSASPVGNAALDMEKMELDFMKVESQEGANRPKSWAHCCI
ncbi:hypothetical protein U1Q18_009870 [Sarracenia purpurea var. burkii]